MYDHRIALLHPQALRFAASFEADRANWIYVMNAKRMGGSLQKFVGESQ